MMKSLVKIIVFTFLVGCSDNHTTIQEWPKNSTVTFSGPISQVSLSTFHSNGTPADKVNLIIEVKTEAQLVECFLKAGWSTTDQLTFLHLSEEVTDIIRDRPYLAAPISSLYLFGRKQDHGFELEVKNSPRQRHHVRFWRSPFERAGTTLWFGAATFDENVEWRHLTHKTDSMIDVERDFVFNNLNTAKCIESFSLIDSKDNSAAIGLKTDNKSFYIKMH